MWPRCSEDPRDTGVSGLHGAMNSGHMQGGVGEGSPCRPGAFLCCPPEPEKFPLDLLEGVRETAVYPPTGKCSHLQPDHHEVISVL